jgi:CheY-like chemotaxis protein
MELNNSSGRKLRRVPYREFVVVNGAIRVRAVDISEGGLYVHTGRSFNPGALVDVSFPIKYEVFNVPAKVRFNEKSVGMGLEFVKLPAAVRRKVAAFVEETADGRNGESRKRKIVAIYDDKSELRLHKSALVSAGYSFVDIRMGKGVHRSLGEQMPINLIILSLEMTRDADFRLISQLKGSPDFGGIPLLVISGNTGSDVAHRVISAGASEFLARMTASPNRILKMVGKVAGAG